MSKKAQSQPMQQEVIDLYDEYTHAPLARREFLERLGRLAGGAAAAAALLPLLEANYAAAQMVPPDDKRLRAESVTYPGASGPVQAYQARPAAGDGKLPGVVVIHENRGLNPHIQDVARRLALEGFLALAPDALSPQGGTPADEDAARRMIGDLNAAQTLGDFVAAVAYLQEYSGSNGRVGCVGFCWGGGYANQLAIHAPGLNAAVVFYGQSPKDEDVPKIHAPLLLHYAGLDTRIGAGVPGYEAALKAAGKPYTLHTYAGVNHAFHNDTAGARYDATAAKLAWGRSVSFFKEHLRG